MVQPKGSTGQADNIGTRTGNSILLDFQGKLFQDLVIEDGQVPPPNQPGHARTANKMLDSPMVVDEQRPRRRTVKRCTLRNPKGMQKLGKIRNVRKDLWVACLRV